MTDYSPDWNLSTIPDAPFYSEAGRRRGIRSTPIRKLAPCVHCGTQLSARQRRGKCPQCGLYQRRDKQAPWPATHHA